MALAPIPWNVDRRTLSEFSEVSLFVFGMIAAPLALWRGSVGWAIGFWGVAVFLRLLGSIKPELLRPIFLGMILVGWPIGWVIANLMLALVYFGLFTPIGLLLRFRRGDLLGRRFDPSASTYWVTITESSQPHEYLRQF